MPAVENCIFYGCQSFQAVETPFFLCYDFPAMIKRNTGFSNLTAGYLFPEVARRRKEYASKHPDASIISLGIGNTTEPLSKHIAEAMSNYALGLATAEGYSGYGDE